MRHGGPQKFVHHNPTISCDACLEEIEEERNNPNSEYKGNEKYR